MRAVLILSLVALAGCSVARLRLPNGVGCDAVAVGDSDSRCCVTGKSSSAGGAFAGSCVDAKGGSISPALAGIAGAAIMSGVVP
jgi:hypothetical protein